MPMTPEERDAATAVHQRLKRRFETIEKNPNLGATGRRNQRAKAQLAAERQLAEIRAAAVQRAQEAVAKAETKMFGYRSVPGGDLTSYRDALLAADAIESPAKALRLLATADQGGDSQLAAAIARRARQMCGPADLGGLWQRVFDAWIEAHPEYAGSATDLDRGTGTVQERLMDNFHTVIVRPDDLRAGPIEQWAAEADAPEADDAA